MRDALPPLARWRLVLGEAAHESLGALDGEAARMDAALEWLYGQDPEGARRDVRGRAPGKLDEPRGSGWAPTTLTVPEWISEVQTLFPRETIERLEKDAIERYKIEEVVTNPEVLSRVEPSEVLLQAVLRTKHLMNPEVLAMARILVGKVVRQLMEKLAKEVKKSFGGTVDRRRRSTLKNARNFDFKRTLKDNLRRYDPHTRRILLEKLSFFSRSKKHLEKWQIILIVDQSGSMLSSTIHSAVTAACLWGLPGIKTHLIAFDTNVIDLTQDVIDPVELLMKVQLGGGNDAAKAIAYASSLIEAPRRTIVVIISDFYEGEGAMRMAQGVKALIEQGTKVLGLCALDEHAYPAFDVETVKLLASVGAQMGAMTPGELAGWIAEKVRG